MFQILNGVDLVDVARIRRILEDDSGTFRSAVWRPAEIAYCEGRAERFATRWAAKEATIKALGARIGTVDPYDIEVRSTPGERPELSLSGAALTRARELSVVSWGLSLSHEAGLAMAFVTGITEREAYRDDQ